MTEPRVPILDIPSFMAGVAAGLIAGLCIAAGIVACAMWLGTALLPGEDRS